MSYVKCACCVCVCVEQYGRKPAAVQLRQQPAAEQVVAAAATAVGFGASLND
jgi:hypothetical protein